ncbi:MAG: DNA repair protein RecO [Flavobacteriales bacterium]|jgi:DNA repair protein RecO (recombination protein O)
MLVTTRAIVLKTIRHGDRTVVLKAWTERSGLRSCMLRTGGKRGVSNAALQPLNRIELVLDEHPERELHPVRELRVERPYTRISLEPVRATLALFVQEVLYRVLREEAADEEMQQFLDEALEAMDSAPDVRHFPLVFLVRLAGHLGFMPEPPTPGEDRFDLREGHFTSGSAQHGHTLGPPLSLALAQVLGADFAEMHRLTVPAAQRRELLDHLLLYFRMHRDGLGELRSPAVLHQVLG